MKSTHYPPSPALAPFVKSFWTIQSSSSDTGLFRFAPDGHPELFFSLSGSIDFAINSGRPGAKQDYGIIGHFERHSDMNVQENQMTFLVKFQAYGLSAIFSENCQVFTNSISAPAALGGLHRELRDLYRDAAGIRSIISVTERWMMSRLHSFQQYDLTRVLCQELTTNFTRPVSSILGGYSLSQRRLQQVFKEKVGISPKQFQRLQRFRVAMKNLPDAPDREAFIYSLGYHDWSHFSKDMSYFFEISPSDYLHYLFRYGQLINVER